MTKLRERWENKEWGLTNIGVYMTEAEKTEVYNKEAAEYCTQNNQDCLTCSMVSYGLDCHNNQIKTLKGKK